MKYIIYLSIFVVGVLGGLAIELLYEINQPTKLLILEENILGEDGMSLPKGTVLTYVGDMPEGYIKANLAVAIEGAAINAVNESIDPRYNLRHQYFFYESE